MRCSHCNFENVAGVVICQVCKNSLVGEPCERCAFPKSPRISLLWRVRAVPGGAPGLFARYGGGNSGLAAPSTPCRRRAVDRSAVVQWSITHSAHRVWGHTCARFDRLSLVPVRCDSVVRRAVPVQYSGDGLAVVSWGPADPYRRVHHRVHPGRDCLVVWPGRDP